MINKKKFVLPGIFVIVLILLVGSQAVFAAPPPFQPMVVTDEMVNPPPTIDSIAPIPPGLFDDVEAGLAQNAADTDACVKETKFWLSLDTVINPLGSVVFFTLFDLLAEGPDTQIWVQQDLSFPPERGLAEPAVTCEQAEYLLGEFENNIYPTEIDFFGIPDFHDGSTAALPGLVGLPADYYEDSDGRQVVLVSNVRDDNYYTDFPLYIAGFYSDTLEFYFDRNVMSIDGYDWENRVGDDAAIPNLYEGVFAHEYQHLLHSDYDGAETNWINEGLSDWAEWLTGYGIPDSHVNSFAAMPENSMTVWEDQGAIEILADYGIAYMYHTYMYNHFGADFIKAEFLNTLQGAASVDDTLSSLGHSDTFASTFHDFTTAVYANTGQFGIPELTDFQVNVGHGDEPNPEAYATDGAPPWGSDYILLWGHNRIKNIRFNGVPFNPIAWTSDGDTLYGGNGNLIDNFAIATVDLTGVTGATINFDTMYEIELGWDFGFVQVSTDGGSTWTSLSNAHTTSAHDPAAHPDIVAELPGLTGSSGGWINMSFDLSAYDGQQVLVAFRHKTDWAVNEAGWYIDNVDIGGVFTSDGSSTAGFQSLNEVLNITNDYTVQLIGERIREGEPEYGVVTLLSGGVMSDWDSVKALLDGNYRRVVVVVTYDAAEGVSSYGGYTFETDGNHDVPLEKE